MYKIFCHWIKTTAANVRGKLLAVCNNSFRLLCLLSSSGNDAEIKISLSHSERDQHKSGSYLSTRQMELGDIGVKLNGETKHDCAHIGMKLKILIT
jgi:hypothetical protein